MSDAPPSQKPSPKPRRSSIDKLREQKAQIDQRLRDAEARHRHQSRKDETARKIEAGALALNHLRENPTSEFARILTRLLNRYVPQHRRHLFTEFGISAKAPDAPVQDNVNPDDQSLKGRFPT